MPEPPPMRSLIRWSFVALGAIVIFALLYYLTRGFGAPGSVAP